MWDEEEDGGGSRSEPSVRNGIGLALLRQGFLSLIPGWAGAGAGAGGGTYVDPIPRRVPAGACGGCCGVPPFPASLPRLCPLQPRQPKVPAAVRMKSSHARTHARHTNSLPPAQRIPSPFSVVRLLRCRAWLISLLYSQARTITELVLTVNK
jgi:hypothetical protein